VNPKAVNSKAAMQPFFTFLNTFQPETICFPKCQDLLNPGKSGLSGLRWTLSQPLNSQLNIQTVQ
jgi:hypothetical protein